MTNTHLMLTLFTGANVVGLASYLPQMVKIMRDQSGARAISCLTWGLFAVSHASTALYAVYVVGDVMIAIIFSLKTCSCVAILLLTTTKRRIWRKRQAAAAGQEHRKRRGSRRQTARARKTGAGPLGLTLREGQPL